MSRRAALALLVSALLALAAIGGAADFGMTIGASLALIIAIVLYPLLVRLDRDGQLALVQIFAIALVARLVVAVAVELLIYRDRPGLFAPDEVYYDIASRYYADYLAGRVPDPYPGILPGAQVAFTGALYFVFGKYPLMVKSVLCVFGAGTAVLTVLLASAAFPPDVSRRAGWLTALFPSLVLWSGLIVKDMTTLFGAQLALLAFMRMRRAFAVRDLLLLIAGVALTAASRAYEVLFVIVGCLGSVVVAMSGRRPLRTLVLFSGLVALLLIFVRQTNALAPVTAEANETLIERVSILRAGYAAGAGSAIDTSLVDTSTIGGLLLWMPVGLFYFFFAPIPFTGTSIIAAATSPEMLIWYFLIPSLWRGLRTVVVGRMTPMMPMLFYTLASSIGYSIVITNVGTIYRYRAQVLFFPLILIASAQMARRKRTT
jgi:hypothetical protein